MDVIKKWSVSLIAVLIICAVFKFAMPSGSIKKYADITLTLIVFAVLLSPLGELRLSDVDIDFFNLEDVEIQSDADYYSSALYTALENVLDSENIYYESLIIDSELDGEGILNIYSIEITLKSEDVNRFLSAMQQRLSLERGIFIINEI